MIYSTKYDCAIDALPHRLVVKVNETCIEAGVNMVDLAYEPGQLDLNDKAMDRGVMLVPGCGVVPGLSNILARYGSYRMSKVDVVRIRVGGIPINPKPPLEYGIMFSVESVIEEYVKPSIIVMDGELMYVPALSGIETIELPEVGKLECFYKDGLSTLPYIMSDVKEMWEKTIRWPGHAEKIMTLRDLGFFNKDEIEIAGAKIKPRDLSTKLLSEKLKAKEDMTILLVEVVGSNGDISVEARYKMIDYYNHEEEVTSMGRTSGYTCAIIAKMIMKKEITGRGVIPPENLLPKDKIEKLLRELWNRGIIIEENIILKRSSW
ncbi:MAG: saccharopine dehydrogenase C-terminal domain-containing protein [Candidatus Methanomethylicia archaeon]